MNRREFRKALALAIGASYERRSMAQLAAWRDGRSVHNPIDNECVPDFSCCNPLCHGRPWLEDRLRHMFYNDPQSRHAITQHCIETIERIDPMQLHDVNLGDGVVRMYARLE